MAATTKHREDKVNLVKMYYLLVLLCLGIFPLIEGKITEYCFEETFLPSCSIDEVIIMTHAMYGRMRLGKCLQHGVNVGCQTDVLPLLETMCSNKQTCEVNVHDLKRNTKVKTPCPLGMITYLGADFECRKVLQIQPSQCRSTSSTIEVTNLLSVSSETLAKSQCGSSSLTLAAKQGQKLNVTILDFSWDETHDESHSCINYLEFRDVSSSSTTPVCAGTSRDRHVITSTGNELTAVFHIQDPTNQRFILQFQAIGCGDISPPEGTWVQRDGDETTLGCHSGKHTWTLTCQHNQWVGAVGSCGTVAFQAEQAPAKTPNAKVEIAPGMVAFAMVSVLLFISSSAFTIGVCVYSKRKEQGMSPKKTIHQQQALIMHDNRTVNQTPRFNQNQSLPFPGRNNMEPVMTVRKNVLNESSFAPNDEQLYFNTTNSVTDSMYSDSVKYYVLENPQDPNNPKDPKMT